MIRFTIEAQFESIMADEGGRQGIRTLMTVKSHGLANRPGEPYPATFHSTKLGGSLVLPILKFRLHSKWTAGESNPDYLIANQESCRWTSSPND